MVGPLRLPRLLLALLLFLPATGWPVPARADDAALLQALENIEPLAWRDPWAARERLIGLRGRLEEAGREARFLYYLRLAHALQYLYLDDEFAAAIDAGKAEMSEATPVEQRLLLQVLDGVRELRWADYKRSRELLSQAVQEADRRQLEFLRVFALVELAFTRSLAGDNELAFPELQEAYASAVEQKDPFLVALVDECFGVLYGYVDEYDKSIEHYEKARDVYADLGYIVYEAEATYGAGVSHRYAKDWNAALAAFQRYRELTGDRGFAHGIFNALYGLGMTYAEMGDCDTALKVIQRGLAATGPKDFKAELYKRQASCLARSGDPAAAEAAATAAREIFDTMPELKGTRWELEVLKVESEVALARGETARAYALLADYLEQITAVQRRNASERLMALRVKMEGARKDYEIELLKEQANLDALRLEQQKSDNRMQRLTTVFWIVITGAVVIFLGFQLRNMQRLRELSSRDELTGLYNRRYIFNFMDKLIQELPPGRGRLSVVVLDVDDFKAINDEYGHPTGDAILESMAQMGNALLRPGDEMARVGGEEFLCVLPRATGQEAVAVARRLLERIREHRFPSPDGGLLQITVSIGVASFGPGCHDADSLYAAADDAMYEAKAGGKNQLQVAA